jgi:murein DD-endopeptidase MepM/ murein hydrolase activator NlpD
MLLAHPGPAQAAGAPGDPFETVSAELGRAPADPVGMWPLVPQPQVVAPFDPPTSTWGAGHRGVDLLGTVGQRVRTALPGRVSFVGRIAGRGVVVVDHGATRTTYEPVAAQVSTGDPVAGGAPLGALELGGSHCLPRACLHWGWIRGEVYLDPLRLVGAGPVRLLPLWRDEPVDARPAPVPGPALPYAGWRPLVALVSGQALGCACW